MPLRVWRAGLGAAAALMLMAGQSAAAGAAPAIWPPLSYAIGDVRIELSRQGGAVAGPRHTLYLYGDGVIEARTGGDIDFRRPLARGEFLTILNRLYRMRFFALPDDMLTRYSVHADAEGRVTLGALRPPDRGSTRLCVRIRDQEKCTAFAKDAPGDLVNLARDVSALAQRTE